ncbi:uncharacterized protein LOC115334365 [Aquila chrysaetos chrysaetos]|uniref:uncharacterized protein LOC115334365 n=1 Tax=Aquila chrysaetos chrysaetos TaxID=223781 RepID=UPI001177255D|nr:uncharacterized protein LOC115334365 [Aquila chrysaetos chrysaetos]
MKERPAAEVVLSRWQGLPWLFRTWERAAQRCRQPPRVMQHDKPPVLPQPRGEQQGGGRGGSRLILPPCTLPSHASRSLLRGKGLARGRQGVRQLGAVRTPQLKASRGPRPSASVSSSCRLPCRAAWASEPAAEPRGVSTAFLKPSLPPCLAKSARASSVLQRVLQPIYFLIEQASFGFFFFLLGDAALGCREVAGVRLATVPLPTRGETMQQVRVSCVPIHQKKMQPTSASRTGLCERPPGSGEQAWGLQLLGSCNRSPEGYLLLPWGPSWVPPAPPGCPHRDAAFPQQIDPQQLPRWQPCSCPSCLFLPHARSQQGPRTRISSPGTL